MAQINWRTINIDALDPESSANFDLSTLTPGVQPVSVDEVQTLAGQIKQLLRGGDSEGALRGSLENPPYGADDRGKVRVIHEQEHVYKQVEEKKNKQYPQGGGNITDVKKEKHAR